MGIRDWFKNDQRKVADLVATQNGVDPKGIQKMSEVGEWLQDVKEDDPRRQKIPPEMLEADYFLFSNNREFGTIVRVTPENVEIRLPYELLLPSGVKVPHSHVFRRLPVRALAALDGQRAQKVLRNVGKDATRTFQEHQKLCSSCFSQVAPKRYPGNPEEGVLGPPADKFTICGTCKAKEEVAARVAAEAAAAAKAAVPSKAPKRG